MQSGRCEVPERGNVASQIHGEIEQCGGVEGCYGVGVGDGMLISLESVWVVMYGVFAFGWQTVWVE